MYNIDESIYENGQDSLHLFLLSNLSTCEGFQKEYASSRYHKIESSYSLYSLELDRHAY